jgi:hypothetical protein
MQFNSRISLLGSCEDDNRIESYTSQNLLLAIVNMLQTVMLLFSFSEELRHKKYRFYVKFVGYKLETFTR